MSVREQQKKSTGARASGKPSAAKQKELQAEREQRLRGKNQAWSVILFAVGVFTLLLIFIEGSSGWKAMHTVFRGVFGLGVFAIPAMSFYIAVLRAKQKSQSLINGKIVEIVILLLLLTAAYQIIFTGKLSAQGGEGFKKSVSFLFEEGKTLEGGGVISAILGAPLLLLGRTGGTIVVLLLVFIVVMFVLDITLQELFLFFSKPFKSAAGAVKDSRDEALSEKAEKRGSAENKPKEEKKRNASSGTVFDDIDIRTDRTTSPAKPATPSIPMISPIDEINMAQKKPLKEEKFEFDIKIPHNEVVGAEEKAQIQREYDKPSRSESTPAQITPGLKKLFPELSELQCGKATQAHDAAKSITQTSGAAEKNDEKPQDKSELDKLIDSRSKIVVENKSANTADIEKKYNLPPVELLKKYDNKKNEQNAKTEMYQNSELLVKTLADFKVDAKVVDIHRGPSVTRYELQPAVGVKISKISSLTNDIMMKLKAEGVRIEAPIPGKDAVGVEVPNRIKDTVSFRSMIESYEFGEMRKKSKLAIAVGKDIDGNVIIGDISKMPHLIVAGTTGSGKSVCTSSMIMSILYNAKPDEVKLILIDPKLVEFPKFNGIKHLLMPVVTDPNKAAGALNWAVQLMLERYQKFNEAGVSDLFSYNKLAEADESIEKMPQILIVIDEFSDLMMAAKNDVEKAVCRIAQMARAAGMHLIIATQRPTVDVVTGLIKANIPSRIALKTFAKIDSVTVLDMAGAESMLGNGDMLYFPTGFKKPKRVQGCFCAPEDVNAVVEFLKRDGEAVYDENITREIEQCMPVDKNAEKQSSGSDELDYSDDKAVLERAIEVVVEMGQASTTSLQKKLKLGYARASRIMDELEEIGVVGPYEGAKPRRVLMTQQQLRERRLRAED